MHAAVVRAKWKPHAAAVNDIQYQTETNIQVPFFGVARINTVRLVITQMCLSSLLYSEPVHKMKKYVCILLDPVLWNNLPLNNSIIISFSVRNKKLLVLQ